MKAYMLLFYTRREYNVGVHALPLQGLELVHPWCVQEMLQSFNVGCPALYRLNIIL